MPILENAAIAVLKQLATREGAMILAERISFALVLVILVEAVLLFFLIRWRSQHQ